MPEELEHSIPDMCMGIVKRLLVILLVSSLAFPISAELEDIFQNAVTAFENNDFETSLELFLSLENEGISNPDLFYNIGNCYFRSGSFGKSILYYKRALKIDQDHKPSRRNLEHVLTYTQDKQIQEDTDLIGNIWKKLLNSLPLNTLAIIVFFLFAIGILLLTLMITHYRQRERTSLIFSFSLVLILLIVFSVLSYVKYDQRMDDTEAVLLVTSAIGYSGPGEDYTRVFTIHEGMLFQIERTENDWSLIKLSNGLGGWIKRNSFQRI